MMGGQLYKATAAIAAGETITPGSSGNVAATSVAAEFAGLKFEMLSGSNAITYVSNSYVTIGGTDARLYKFPFGLAVLSFYFTVNNSLGSTEQEFATIPVTLPNQIGATLVSQQGNFAAMFIRTNGKLVANSATASTGTYHVCIAFPYNV